MSEEFSLFGYGREVIDEMVRYHLGEMIFYGGLATSLFAWHYLRTIRILHSGKLSGPTAVIQTTSYDPAYRKTADGGFELIINPVTGNNFRDQKIRTEELPINLGNLFDKEISGRLVKYFNKAAKCASAEAPVVYLHLNGILPTNDAQKITEIIQNSVQNYISGLYRDTEKVLAANLKPDEFFETNKILPVLVREEGAIGWQLRLLLLKLNDEGTIDLPDPRDVRYAMPDGSYESGSKSLETDRFKTLTAVKNALDDAVLKRALSGYVVEIPNGHISRAQLPAPIAAPA